MRAPQEGMASSVWTSVKALKTTFLCRTSSRRFASSASVPAARLRGLANFSAGSEIAALSFSNSG